MGQQASPPPAPPMAPTLSRNHARGWLFSTSDGFEADFDDECK